MKFGYLNKGNPTEIDANEAQEIHNCKIERGFLKYASFPVNSDQGRKIALPNFYEVEIDDLPGFSGLPKWRISMIAPLGVIGIDQPSSASGGSGLPTVETIAHASNPYPAGTYQYALTLYNPDTGEESVPALFTVTTIDHSTPGNEAVRFNSFPSVAALYPQKPAIKWRLYRMSIGGTEFFLVAEFTATSSTASYTDTTADEDVSDIICDSLTNFVTPLRREAVSMLLYGDRLWIAEALSKRLWFSKVGKWWAFPAENFLQMEESVYGLAELNENLAAYCFQKAFYIIYGNSELNFQPKKIDIDPGITMTKNSWRIANGTLFVPGLKDYDMPNLDDSEKPVQVILAFDGIKALDISTKIQGFLPKFAQVIYPDLTYPFFTPSALIDQRFVAFELDNASMDISNPSEFIPNNTVTLVLDSYKMGFMTASNSGLMSYRTKDFAMPPNIFGYKRIYVRAKGTVTVQIMVDGDYLLDEFTHDFTSLKTEYFNIADGRYDTFSFRFIGDSDTEIHDYGVEK